MFTMYFFNCLYKRKKISNNLDIFIYKSRLKEFLPMIIFDTIKKEYHEVSSVSLMIF